MGEKYTTINGDLIAQTEMAWLVRVNDDENKQTWIAKSQIHEIDPDAEVGDTDMDIVVNSWYYSNKLKGVID